MILNELSAMGRCLPVGKQWLVGISETDGNTTYKNKLDYLKYCAEDFMTA